MTGEQRSLEQGLAVSDSADRNKYEIFGEPRNEFCASRIGRLIRTRPKPCVLEAVERLMAKVVQYAKEEIQKWFE